VPIVGGQWEPEPPVTFGAYQGLYRNRFNVTLLLLKAVVLPAGFVFGMSQVQFSYWRLQVLNEALCPSVECGECEVHDSSTEIFACIYEREIQMLHSRYE
jgi:hypothetical protein